MESWDRMISHYIYIYILYIVYSIYIYIIVYIYRYSIVYIFPSWDDNGKYVRAILFRVY